MFVLTKSEESEPVRYSGLVETPWKRPVRTVKAEKFDSIILGAYSMQQGKY